MSHELFHRLKRFVSCKETFKVLYQSSSNCHLIENLFILDSSFNPPHKGHLSMIQKSIEMIDQNKRLTGILLLFSLKNADKTEVDIDEYIRRIQMIKIMYDYLVKDKTLNGVSILVGVTKKSMFIDKNEDILANFPQLKDTYYLLGFDTLIRLFNLKYYNGSSDFLAKFGNFFQTARIITLLRNYDADNMNIADQVQYIEQFITKNKLRVSDKCVLDVPSSWSERLRYYENKNHWGISSSEIRNKLSTEDQTWIDDVVPGIEVFLKEKKNDLVAKACEQKL